MSGDSAVEKEIESLELKKKELELFINTYNPQLVPVGSPRHLRKLEELNELFTSAGVIKETFRIESLPPKIGKDKELTQDFKIQLTFKSFPFLLINIDITTVGTVKDSLFYQLDNIVFNVTPDSDHMDYVPAFSLFNDHLSRFKLCSPLYLRILKRFLTLLNEREIAFNKVKQSLTPNQYEIIVNYEKGNEWTLKYLMNSHSLATVTWSIVLNNEFSAESTYLLEFSDVGEKQAREFYFPEEVFTGHYQSWNGTKCVEELIKLTSLMETKHNESDAASTKSTPKSKLSSKRNKKRLIS